MSTTVLYPDINVLVYAYRDDSPYHEVCDCPIHSIVR